MLEVWVSYLNDMNNLHIIIKRTITLLYYLEMENVYKF